MSIIDCSECGNRISDKAMTCPHCGVPMRSVKLDPTSHARVTRTGAKWEAAGFILILAGMFSFQGGLSAGLAFLGFVVFIVGRFL
jgi:hypothetical protein